VKRNKIAFESENTIGVFLTNDEITVIDADDKRLIRLFGTWIKHGNYVRVIRNATPGRKGERQKELLHRLIMYCPRNLTVDHIDGNPLNNRKSNLRLATTSENASNRRKAPNKTGYIGVQFVGSCRRNPWRVYVAHKMKKTFLGYFPTAEVAARAYDEKAKQLKGDFARLNFPNEKMG
jgi:hypothetical protein